MRRLLLYLRLSIKNTAKLFPSLLALCAVFLIIAAALLLSVDSDGGDELASIGAVGETDDPYIKVAATLLTETDTVSINMYDSEEEAMDALVKREIQGYAHIPDGFMYAAMTGKNIPFTYTVLKNPASLSHSLTSEIISSVSVVVSESQNSVYGMRQYLKDSDNRGILSEESDKMSARMIIELLNRGALFETVTRGVADSVSLAGYYIAAIATVFVLLASVVVSHKVIKKDMSLQRLLTTRGIGATWQVVSEVLAFFLFLWSSILLTGGAIDLFASFSKLPDSIDIGFFSYAIRLAPAVLLLSAMQFFLCEVCDSAVSGQLILFFTSVFCAYISGCFYPSFFFPAAVQDFALLLPVGRAVSLSREILAGVADSRSLITAALYTALLIALTVGVRRIRMRGDGV